MHVTPTSLLMHLFYLGAVADGLVVLRVVLWRRGDKPHE